MSWQEQQTTPEQGEKVPLVSGPPTLPQQVVVVQPVAGPVFKDYPVTIPDGNGGTVQTELRYKIGLFTWIAVGVACLITVGFGCPCLGLIPLCINAFKDVEHINPVDGTVVGCYKRTD